MKLTVLNSPTEATAAENFWLLTPFSITEKCHAEHFECGKAVPLDTHYEFPFWKAKEKAFINDDCT